MEVILVGTSAGLRMDFPEPFAFSEVSPLDRAAHAKHCRRPHRVSYALWMDERSGVTSLGRNQMRGRGISFGLGIGSIEAGQTKTTSKDRTAAAALTELGCGFLPVNPLAAITI